MDKILTTPVPDLVVPSMDLYSYVVRDWGEFLDETALVDTSNERQFTYQQALDTIAEKGNQMKKFGLQRGDVISIWCSNCIEMVLISLAAWKIGVTVAMIPSSILADEGKQYIERVRSCCVFVSVTNRPKLLKAFNILPEQILFTFGECDFVTLRRRGSHNSTGLGHKIDLNDTAVILFSSGTTGLPKAVELTHSNMTIALFVGSSGRLSPCLVFLPLTHFYGLAAVLKLLGDASQALIMPRFDLEEYMRLTSKYQLISMVLVPPVAVMMAKHPELVKKYDLSSVVILVSSGAVLSLETAKQIQQLLPDTLMTVAQGYGLTETTGTITATDLETPLGSVGRVVPTFELKIVSVDTGKSCGPMEEGEIVVRGPKIMKGYLDDPKSTAEIIDSDGWLHTGDVGYYNEDSYLFIVDRIKELIKHKGQQVAPAELENILLAHPDIKDVAVVGIPDEMMGELPTAFVVEKVAGRTTEKQLQDYVAERVAPYKRLTGGVKFVSSIPKLPSGKILRRQLRSSITQSRL